jgi:hypothetical protein
MLTLFAQVLLDSGEREGVRVSSDLAHEIRSLLARTHSALQDRARMAGGSAQDRPRGHGQERPAYDRWLTYAWGDPRLERLFAREDWPIPWAAAPSK